MLHLGLGCMTVKKQNKTKWWLLKSSLKALLQVQLRTTAMLGGYVNASPWDEETVPKPLKRVLMSCYTLDDKSARQKTNTTIRRVLESWKKRMTAGRIVSCWLRECKRIDPKKKKAMVTAVWAKNGNRVNFRHRWSDCERDKMSVLCFQGLFTIFVKIKWRWESCNFQITFLKSSLIGFSNKGNLNQNKLKANVHLSLSWMFATSKPKQTATWKSNYCWKTNL